MSNPISHLRFAVAAGIALGGAAGCGESADIGPDAGPDAAAPTGQGSEARGDLIINEVAPKGEGADWIELHNRSTAAIDLCGWFLTDQVDRLDHYLPLGGVIPPATCPAHPIAAGAYLIVYADDTPIPADDPAAVVFDHAPFQLGIADEVHLVAIDGLTGDGVLFLYPSDGDGDTLARRPDGKGAFFLASPSSGAANPEVL